MLAILFTGIVSAQTFSFGCGPDTSEGLKEGHSAFVGEPGQHGIGSINTYAQYSIPEHLRGIPGRTGTFRFYLGIDRDDPQQISEVTITDGVITEAIDFMDGVTHTMVEDHTVVFQKATQGLYNQARVGVTAVEVILGGGGLQVFGYRNGSIDRADFPNWRQEIRDAIRFGYRPATEGSTTHAVYYTVLDLPTHLIGINLNGLVIGQRFQYTVEDGSGDAGQYIFENGDVRASADGASNVNVVNTGAFSYGIETTINLNPSIYGANGDVVKLYRELAYSRAEILLSVSGLPVTFTPPRTLAFFPGWQDELDQALNFDVSDGGNNRANVSIYMNIPGHLRGFPGITRSYDASVLRDEDESGALLGGIVVIDGVLQLNGGDGSVWKTHHLAHGYNESRLSATVSVAGTQIINYQFGIRMFVWNWTAGATPNLEIRSGTKVLELDTASTSDGTHDFGNGNVPNFRISRSEGNVYWHSIGVNSLLNFPGSAATDDRHRTHWGGANWMYRVNITETEREFVRYWYRQAGYTPEEY